MENRNWREYKVKDIAEVIGGGTPRTDNPDFWNGDIPWITPRDLTGYSKMYISKGERLISSEGLKGSSTRLLPKGAVLLTSRAPIGYVAIANNEICTNQGFKSLVLNEELAYNKFIYYWIKNNIDYLQSIGTGTTFAEISGNVVKEIEIQLPPLPEQKAIASVLSSLDDKIDLLHQQNQTLEALAETLFRQWFIERCPEPVEGEAKEDWEERPLSFFGKIICGKTPSKKQSSFFNGIHPFIKIPDMHGKTFVFETSDTLTEEGLKSQFNKTIPEKSINVSCIATVGLVTMNAHISQTNQQINSIIPIDVFRYYIYCQMKNSFELLQAMASGGTATPNLNTGDFSKISIPNPDNDILKKFNTEVSPIFDKIFENSKQIQTLTQLRDTLLPKLMSGAVSLSNCGEVRVKMQTD